MTTGNSSRDSNAKSLKESSGPGVIFHLQKHTRQLFFFGLYKKSVMSLQVETSQHSLAAPFFIVFALDHKLFSALRKQPDSKNSSL